MTNKEIDIFEVDRQSLLFSDLYKKIMDLYIQGFNRNVNAITGYRHFVNLYNVTAEFYRHNFPGLWNEYVPLFHSVWRQDALILPSGSNLHQDEAVYSFGKGGYSARMLNVWICMDKDLPKTLAADELGIYVIEQAPPENAALYARLVKADSHFYMNRAGQLTDNTRVGGEVISCDMRKLVCRAFSYDAGTAILFNSHLLHGTRCSLSGFGPEITGSRVALTSVWVHKEDLDWEIVDCPPKEYENIYLRGHDLAMRLQIKQYFPAQCAALHAAISHISDLVKFHYSSLGENSRPGK